VSPARAPRPAHPLAAPDHRIDVLVVDTARFPRDKTCVDGAPLLRAHLDAVGVRADIGDLGPVRARAVVGADGMWSPLRRAVGLAEPGYRGEGHAARQHGSLDGSALRRLWPELLARPAIRGVIGPDAAPESRPRAWPIPAAVHRAALGVGPVVLVGDAAAILDGGPTATADLADRNGAAVRRHLAPDHRMTAALARVLSSPRRAERVIATLGATDRSRRAFARWLFEDSARGIALTPRRWHRGALHGDGAFGAAVRSRPRHGAETRPR